jgi:serine/threonine protein kinase
MAPEIILGSGHNRGVDYFALGVFIYEMIIGQTPYFDYDTDSIMRKIVRGRLRFGPKLEGPVKALLEVREQFWLGVARYNILTRLPSLC